MNKLYHGPLCSHLKFSCTMLETTFSFFFHFFWFPANTDQESQLTIYINFSPVSLKHLSYANSPKTSVD